MGSVPARIGSFEVERELGRGGMGVVYLARDPRHERHVALKALPEAFVADSERRARLEREARALAAASHPNIAGIFGLETAGDQLYLVLEYVAGETLLQRLARGPLPFDEAGSSWPDRSPRASRRRTRPAWCTATSSRATSCSTGAVSRWWWTSDWHTPTTRRRRR